MRNRAFIQVGGAHGSGKTLLVERLLATAGRFLPGVVRCERVSGLKSCAERRPRGDAELQRYEACGVMFAARFRFPPDAAEDAFWSSRFIDEYSGAIVIEGDLPAGVFPDLTVYVARPLPEGEPLVCRVVRPPPAPERRILEIFGVPAARFSRPVERRGVRDGYGGIERAQVVLVNVRSDAERIGANRLVTELGLLRADKKLFKDVVPWHGSRVSITAVVANLSDAKDAGLKKALARIRRTIAAQAGS